MHPKFLIDDLIRQSRNGLEAEAEGYQTDFADIFADFNGLPEGADRTELYQHDANWSNRMILGDRLQVMASLSEREGLAGKVQCIFVDPPYGIRFNSNFQWSTTSRDVQDGKRDHITREPEQVKAFRDTWRDGIHSYLSCLRDRLTMARDLLADSGSIFVQIGDENVHRVRALLDEVFGDEAFISEITVAKTGSQTGVLLGNIVDLVLWYAKDRTRVKFRQLYVERNSREETVYSPDPLKSGGNVKGEAEHFEFAGRLYSSGINEHWKTNNIGMERLKRADRIVSLRNSIRYKRYFQDYPAMALYNLWTDLGGATGMVYLVQTATKMVERCILMSTDPGDLVLDPACGSGTAAYVSEQWGRRWITIDTSRVALALARSRIMGARYPYYLLADSLEGQRKEAGVTGKPAVESPTYGHVRQGFVYERVPHISLRDIANNPEIDVTWESAQRDLEPLREALNAALGRNYQKWGVPREPSDPWPESAAAAWLIARGPGNTEADNATALRVLNTELGRNYTLDDVPDQPRDPWEPVATDLQRRWWELRIARQKAIDDSIARNAEFEYLYDKPYEGRGKVRVAGPFTVESVSPHRTLEVDENGDTFDRIAEGNGKYAGGYDFATVILQNLKTAGVAGTQRRPHHLHFTHALAGPICLCGRPVH